MQEELDALETNIFGPSLLLPRQESYWLPLDIQSETKI